MIMYGLTITTNAEAEKNIDHFQGTPPLRGVIAKEPYVLLGIAYCRFGKFLFQLQMSIRLIHCNYIIIVFANSHSLLMFII